MLCDLVSAVGPLADDSIKKDYRSHSYSVSADELSFDDQIISKYGMRRNGDEEVKTRRYKLETCKEEVMKRRRHKRNENIVRQGKRRQVLCAYRRIWGFR